MRIVSTNKSIQQRPARAPRSLSLSTDQLGCVMIAASAIPQIWRSRFLESVSDILMGSAAEIDDNAVTAAVDEVLRRIGMK